MTECSSDESTESRSYREDFSFGCSRAVVLRMRSYMLVMNSVLSSELSATTTRACSTVLPWESASFAFALWNSLSSRKSTTLAWLVQAARDRGSSPEDKAERQHGLTKVFVQAVQLPDVPAGHRFKQPLDSVSMGALGASSLKPKAEATPPVFGQLCLFFSSSVLSSVSRGEVLATTTRNAVIIISVIYRNTEQPVASKNLIASERAPAAHNPPNPGLLQMLSRHHGRDVVQDSTTQRSGHVTQRQIGGGDVGHLTEAERVVSLSEDGRTHTQVTGFLVQAATNQLLVQTRITHLNICEEGTVGGVKVGEVGDGGVRMRRIWRFEISRHGEGVDRALEIPEGGSYWGASRNTMPPTRANMAGVVAKREGPQFISEVAVRGNAAVLDYCRTSVSALSGATAGILGLTGLYGFIFYFLASFLLSLLLILKAGRRWNKCFKSRRLLFTGGLVGGLFTYVLFWTFLYGMFQSRQASLRLVEYQQSCQWVRSGHQSDFCFHHLQHNRDHCG
ncbi:hypothetical protein INR49_015000 [Caranx melampygus]|nr:hypothetical protein INR49_015000 [Caranx melampygus]